MCKPDETTRNNRKGLCYSATAAALLASTWITGKYSLAGFNCETFVLVWLGCATAANFLFMLVTGTLRDILIERSDIGSVVMLGVITGVGSLLAWRGLDLLDPAFSAFLWRMMPVLSILAGVLLLRERITGYELLPIIVMVGGGCISTIGRWQIVGAGTLLTIAACSSAALQLVIAKARTGYVSPAALSLYRVGLATLVVLCWLMITGKADFHVPARYWIVAALGAALGPCAGYLFIFSSYRYWDLSRSSMLITTQPLLVLPMAYLFLDKLPNSRELLGGLVILAGAMWLGYIHLRRAPPQDSIHSPPPTNP